MSVSIYAGVTKWTYKDGWRERFQQVLEDHLGGVWEQFDCASYDELAECLGPGLWPIAWNTAFEDMLARVWDDGANLVEDYLKRRGFKETATSRDLLGAYRGTVPTLWEILEIREGRSLLVQDLVCGGDPVWVDLHDSAAEPGLGDHLGARLLRTRRGPRLGLSALPFDSDESAGVLSMLRGQITDIIERDGCDPAEAGRRALAFVPGLITMEWLAIVTAEDDGDDWEEDDPSDASETFAVSWSVKPGVSPQDLRAALRLTPSVRVFAEGTWFLMDQTAAGPDVPVEKTLVGPVTLTADQIVLVTLSRERADHGLSLLTPALEGLVEPPLITEVKSEPD